MDFNFTIGILGGGALVIGALVLGVGFQFFGDGASAYEWLATSIAAFAGGFAASEFIVAWRGFEPVFDGLAIVPALMGGLVVGLLVGLAARFVTGGTYTAAQTR